VPVVTNGVGAARLIATSCAPRVNCAMGNAALPGSRVIPVMVVPVLRS
jgi:hypothetical protein